MQIGRFFLFTLSTNKNNIDTKGIIHPNMKISVVDYSSSCRSKSVRLLFIFVTQLEIFF